MKQKILFVGTEAMPFAATGGLGDVLGSLPAKIKACDPEKYDVRVVMPLYGVINRSEYDGLHLIKEINVPLAWRNLFCGIWEYHKDDVVFYFLDNEYFFKRPDIYGNYDDGERFAFFSAAVLQMLAHLDFYPDILHAHDWQSALSVIYLKRRYSHIAEYAKIKAVYTIHNIEYQGKYDFSILGDVFALESSDKGIVEYNGCINLMKGAIICADQVTTVSPTYAQELKSPEFAHGLDPVLREIDYKLTGILNGIDTVYYNPAQDKNIFKTYSSSTIQNKAQNKCEFQKMVGLPVNESIPMYAIISRLVAHKGIDLVELMVERLLEQNVQLVILGKGDIFYENFFVSLQNNYPSKVVALMVYNRDLSKKVYAAADLFIMPSKSEPCGLSQMIASRYGAVPICRETGGLYDSIKGYYEKGGKVFGNGFTFANYNADELYDRCNAAYQLYTEKEKWQKLVKKVMLTDFSWQTQGLKYIKLYESLLEV